MTSEKIKGGVWLHFAPKFVTDCKAHKIPTILCMFIEFFMQIDQPIVLCGIWFTSHNMQIYG